MSEARARPAGRAAELALLSPRRAALQLAWPGILENLIRVGAQTAFYAVVGHLGANELAAYGASIQYLFLLFPVWQSLSIGSIALVSRRMGSGEPAEAAAFARQSLLLGLALALVTGAAFFLFAEQLLLAYGAAPAVAAIGAPYLRLSGGANAVTTLLVIALAILRAGGDTRSPFVITAVSAAVSVPLGFTLLDVVGLPGVALGWIVANGTALAWALALLWRGGLGFRLGDGPWRLERGRVRTLLDISLPSAGDQVAITLGVWLLGFLALRLGTETYAAHNVVGQVESISFLPCIGFATAASVMVGQSLGMEDAARAERSGWAAAQTAVVWTSLAGLAMIVFAEPAMRAFTSDDVVVGAGVGAMRVIGFGQPAQAINFVMGGGLRGAGDTRFTMLVSVFDWFVMRLPLALLFGFALNLGLLGLWLALVIDYFVRGSILIWRFRSRAWARRRY